MYEIRTELRVVEEHGGFCGGGLCNWLGRVLLPECSAGQTFSKVTAALCVPSPSFETDRELILPQKLKNSRTWPSEVWEEMFLTWTVAGFWESIVADDRAVFQNEPSV